MLCDLQEVKGAAWTAIASCVHSTETAAAAWSMYCSLLVSPRGCCRGADSSGGGGGRGDSSVAIPQYDMTYQVNEIEVRSFLLLCNLTEHAVFTSGGGGSHGDRSGDSGVTITQNDMTYQLNEGPAIPCDAESDVT